MRWSRASEHLTASHNYWIHTTRVDGRPHVKPVWGLWFEERFYFSSSPRSVTARNLAANPSLVAHLESGNEVVMLEGTTEQVTDASPLSRLDEAYFTKYAYHISGDMQSGTVYVLNHKVAFAWVEHDFVGSATRYAFE